VLEKKSKIVQPSSQPNHQLARADQDQRFSQSEGWDLMATTAKTARNSYRSMLLKKRNELLASAKGQPAALAADIQTPDAVEFATKAAEQDVAAATANLRSRMLKEIDWALRRVAGGTYGVCEGCGEEIAPARLKAIPWARYCLVCQELRSRN
jgi:DnaK suppressor protein